jgi:hypothetical protein
MHIGIGIFFLVVIFIVIDIMRKKDKRIKNEKEKMENTEAHK